MKEGENNLEIKNSVTISIIMPKKKNKLGTFQGLKGLRRILQRDDDERNEKWVRIILAW